ncbi:MAG: PAS domain S-box protein [Limnospira sp.]
MFEQLQNWLISQNYIPHGHCYLWQPDLVGLHLLSDSLIALAYYSIPVILAYFAHKRQDLPFRGIFLLFSLFIITCGSTHLMAVVTLWYPFYWLSGTIKAITAFTSCYTALALIPVLPKALALPSPTQLRDLNETLERRAAELTRANDRLQQEIRERQQAEAELLKERARFRAMFDAAAIGIALVDDTGHPFTTNRALQNFLGYSAEELGKMTFADFTHPADRSVDRQLYQELISGERNVYQLEKRYIRKDRRQVWGYLTVSRVRARDGLLPADNPNFAIGMVEDIQERKQAETELEQHRLHLEELVADRTEQLTQMNRQLLQEIQRRERIEMALRDSEERFREIFEDAPIGIFVCLPPDYYFAQVNQAFCEIVGYSAEELQTLSDEEITHPEDIISTSSQSRVMVSCKPDGFQLEKRYLTKTGAVRWVSLTTRVRRNLRGEVLYILAMVEDINDRRLTEIALRESEERLRAILDNSPALIYMKNLELQYLLINRKCGDVCNFDPEDVEGKTAYDIFPEELADVFSNHDRQVLNLKVPLQFEEQIFHGGEYHTYLSIQCPLLDSDGNIYGVCGISTDITVRKQMEDELACQNKALERATQAAEAANHAKSEFLANMSHEIRTPMNAILGFCELLENLVQEPLQRSYLQSIASSGRTLLALINDILDLSKIEAGKFQLHYEAVDLRQILTEVEQIFSQKAAQKNLSLATEVSRDVPTCISFDEVRLRQILFNVVGNAFKFTARGGIKISMRRRPSETLSPAGVCLEIAVEDTGIGIAPEQQDDIFDAFRQSEGQSNRKYGGTGLGLAITKRLTEILGGRIELQSELGRGSRFTFIFPQVRTLDSAFLPDQLEFNSQKSLADFAPMTILVVDDVASNRELIRGYFARTQHTILMADNGSEAIAIARSHHPELILLDWRMPNMDGQQVASVLKTDPTTQDIPIVILTASAFLQEQQQWRSLYDGFLRKPVSRAQLVADLEKLFPTPEGDTSGADDTLKGAISGLEISPKSAWVPERIPELLEKLRQEEETTWTELCQTLIWGEIHQFVDRLEAWGNQYQCSQLLEYADRLKTEQAEFDVDGLQRTVELFPEVIESIQDGKNT